MTNFQRQVSVWSTLFLSVALISRNAVAGSCTMNADCNDGIPCTIDVCGAGNQCVYTPVDAICGAGQRCVIGVGCEPIYKLLAHATSSGGGKSGSANYSISSSTGQAGGISTASNGPISESVLEELDDIASSEFFRASRESETYLSMSQKYGKPWQFGANQKPQNVACVDGVCVGGPNDGVADCGSRFPTCTDPAEQLRAFGTAPSVFLSAGFWPVENTDRSEYPTEPELRFEVLKELWSFEMLLGNEAFADALDPTIGGCNSMGQCVPNLGNLFAFQGTACTPTQNCPSLLEEELALLGGRRISLPITDTASTYPEYSSGDETARAAVYNRLPPNATNLAYPPAYSSLAAPITSNFEAVTKGFPQGHGDAYGYYLTALKAYLGVFRGDGDPDETGAVDASDPADPGKDLVAQRFIDGQASAIEDVESGKGFGVAVPFEGVRQFVSAAAARARTSARIVDLTFRRDYSERADVQNLEDMQTDSAGRIAWGTADWAQRSAMGAYFDWAVSNQLLPPSDPDCEDGECSAGLTCVGGPFLGETCADDADCACDALGFVHRFSVEEVGELAASVGQLQERLDAAGAGLSPLGLVQNVLSFGIDKILLANWAENRTGKSHYQQMREKAEFALQNASAILAAANNSLHRLRESEADLDKFDEQVDDSEANFNNRLIELFGYPSRDDPSDNDFDPTTASLGDCNGCPPGCLAEACVSPDLLNFLLDAEAIADRIWTARIAPGEIQLAMSELRISELRGDEADLALADLEAQIDDHVRRIEIETDTVAAEIQIINDAGAQLMALTERLKQIKTRCNTWCKLKKGAKVIAAVASAAVACVGTVGGGCGPAVLGAAAAVKYVVESANAAKQLRSEFDIQKERERVQSWEKAQITGIRGRARVENLTIDLEAAIRKTPQHMVNLAIAAEGIEQAFGRLNAAVQGGNRLLQERERIHKLQRDDLADFRWKDVAFRTFRNNALQHYDGFFNLAARYVMLAGKAFAYEFNERTDVDPVLASIHSERLLGTAGLPTTGGLYGVLLKLELEFNQLDCGLPALIARREVRFRRSLFGLGSSIVESRKFRDELSAHIVQRLENLPVARDYLETVVSLDYGPALVLPFATEANGRNFFGNIVDPPYGGARFDPGRNAKILKYALRFEGVDGSALGNPKPVFYYLVPVGHSVFYECTNCAPIDVCEPLRMWFVVDQFLHSPSPISTAEYLADSGKNPWRETGGLGGNQYLGAATRFRKSEMFLGHTGPPQGGELDTALAGRAIWNTDWLLIIPGAQFTDSTDPVTIRNRLDIFLYGAGANPDNNVGITDIVLFLDTYGN